MIPFENLVSELISRNVNVGYFVTMIPKPGEAWAAEAVIEINIIQNEEQVGKAYRLKLKAEPENEILLSQAGLDGTQEFIDQFKSDFGIL